MTPDQQQQLVDNIVGSMGTVPEEIQRRQIDHSVTVDVEDLRPTTDLPERVVEMTHRVLDLLADGFRKHRREFKWLIHAIAASRPSSSPSSNGCTRARSSAVEATWARNANHPT